MNDFNIFRINCWLEDPNGNNFVQSIKSIIYEIIYNNKNNPIVSLEIYQSLTNEFEILIDVDFFTQIIQEDENIIKTPTEFDSSLKLTDKKYSDIFNNLEKNSIEYHVEKFLKKKKYDLNFGEKICQQLANALYENILVFTTSNIKSILTSRIINDFKQNEIDLFNEFIDFDDDKKNNAIYSTFLKAIEFAILTSGKGVKEISNDVFKNKKYFLDTNIIIRLIGIGGVERKNALISLLDSCIHEGIKFEISFVTEKELKDKIREKCDNLRKSIDSHSLDVFKTLIFDSGFNYDFETHYGKLVHEGVIKSVNKYELYLLNEYQKIKDKFEVSVISLAGQLDSIKINMFAEEILKSKKDDFGARYTKTAAKVDAINVLGVRKLRGNNNYNYKDIKSFYLTTDRTLNKVLALKAQKYIPETILPSQLFLLHSSHMSPTIEDIKIFTKFIKKRTTEFKLNGSEALKYIEEIREFSTVPSELKQFIAVFAETKYNATSDSIKNFNKPNSFMEFAITEIDKKLIEYEEGNQSYSSALNIAIKKLENSWKKTGKILFVLEFIIFLYVYPQ